MIEVVPTQANHVRNIVLRMRVEEGIERVSLDKTAIVKKAVESATYCFTAKVDDEVACIWGIYQQTMLSNTAYMWLITTPLVEQHQFIFARRSQIYLKDLQAHFHVIQGHVDGRFNRSIRWLKWLGFKIYPMFEDDTHLRPFELRQN